MNIKLVNKILIVLVITLLITAIFAILKVVFSGLNDFEWGSVSDWFSTAASFITTYIAYQAYKAAPNWIKQKSNETGFNHVHSLMSEYDEIEQNLQRLYFDILSTRNNDPMFDGLGVEVKKNVYEIISLQFKLQSCRRWNIEASNDLNSAFQRLKDFCSLSYKVLACERMRDIDNLHLAQQKLTTLKTTISEDSKSFKKDINLLFTFPE